MTWRQLALVCAITALWAVNFGVGSQTVTHWLKLHAIQDTFVGLVHAAYYVGVASAALFVPRLVRRIGLRTTVVGLLLCAASVAAFPLGGGEVGWIALRFLSGAGSALSLIPLETFLSQRARADRRTEIFSYYAAAMAIAGAVGIALGNEWFDDDGFTRGLLGPGRNAFVVAAVFPLIASMLAHHGLARESRPDTSKSEPFLVDWRHHFLSFGTAWSQGFLEGGLLAFLSLHLMSLGMSLTAVGALMGVTMIGVIVFQIPVSWLADRLGRTRTLLACYGVVLATLLSLPWITSLVLLGCVLFLLGACSGAMYPLGLSLLGNKISIGGLSRAFALYTMMECVGSPMGAAIMGGARDLWGGHAMFHVGAAALSIVLAMWIGVQVRVRWPAYREARQAAQVERSAAA
jgi:MFS family permease